MIGLILKGHNYEYEIKMLIKVFYPDKEICKVENCNQCPLTLVTCSDGNNFVAEVYENGLLKYDFKHEENIIVNDIKEYKKIEKRLLKYVLYKVLKKYTNKEMSWGILTGIRPTKIVLDLIEKKISKDEIIKTLKGKYCIADNKIKMMLEVAKNESKIISNNKNNEINIYIGIPFCPTRCLYCSFTSYSVEKYKNIIDDYVNALIKEIKYTAKLFEKLSIRSIYIGGGTPTSLNENQLEKLLSGINKYFRLSEIEEFTVEAGRPDTITKQKLIILKKYGIRRISINPQTMNENTLKVIGRQHTAVDVIDKYNMSRDLQFENINMDFIIGLPGESSKEVKYSMEFVKKLKPDSMTIHTMAVKRASRLKQIKSKYVSANSKEIENMLDIASITAYQIGMKPYYMYRQKNMVGSFENVGYSLPGKESIYNVEIMEEKESIFAFGAGAITKIIFPKEKRIERIENVKNVDHYINRIDEMIERKFKFFESST